MNEYLKRLMDGPSIDTGHRCAICGRWSPLEDHHIVRRSQGGTTGPVIRLCGAGNGLHDGSGRPFCHGLAHANRLHFYWDGREWSYLITDEPTKYEIALGMEGWKPIPFDGGSEEIEWSDDAPWLHSVRTPEVHYVWPEDREPPF